MSKRDADHELQRHIELGHETRDANLRWVLISGAGLLVLVVGTLFLMNWTFDLFHRTETREDAPRPPLADTRVRPSGPLLQANPYGDLKSYREREEAILAGYARHQVGDTPLDTVSIPIERAMDLILERGLPAAAGPATSTAASASVSQTRPGE